MIYNPFSYTSKDKNKDLSPTIDNLPNIKHNIKTPASYLSGDPFNLPEAKKQVEKAPIKINEEDAFNLKEETPVKRNPFSLPVAKESIGIQPMSIAPVTNTNTVNNKKISYPVTTRDDYKKTPLAGYNDETAQNRILYDIAKSNNEIPEKMTFREYDDVIKKFMSEITVKSNIPEEFKGQSLSIKGKDSVPFEETNDYKTAEKILEDAQKAYDDKIAEIGNKLMSKNQSDELSKIKTDLYNAKGWMSRIKGEQNLYYNLGQEQLRAFKDIDINKDLFISIVSDDKDGIDSAMERYNAQAEEMSKYPISYSNKITGGIGAVSGMLPAMGVGIGEGWAVGVTSAAATAAISAAIPGFEEIVTVPAAFLGGQTFGNAQFWYRQGFSEMYKEMYNSGIDDNINKIASSLAGIPYAAIEMVQVSKIFPGASAIVKKSISRATKSTIKRMAIEYGKDWASNVTEEGMQRFIAIITEEVSLNVDKDTEGKPFSEMVAKALSGMGEEMKSVAIPMLLLLGPSNVASGINSTNQVNRVANDIAKNYSTAEGFNEALNARVEFLNNKEKDNTTNKDEDKLTEEESEEIKIIKSILTKDISKIWDKANNKDTSEEQRKAIFPEIDENSLADRVKPPVSETEKTTYPTDEANLANINKIADDSVEGLVCSDKGSCMLATEKISNSLTKNGIKDFNVVEGYVEFGDGKFTPEHTWIELKDGTIIDKTLEQFNDWDLSSVKYLDKNKKIYTPNDYAKLAIKYPATKKKKLTLPTDEANFKTKTNKIELPDFKKQESTLTTDIDKAIAKYPNDLEKATEEFVEGQSTLPSDRFTGKTGVSMGKTDKIFNGNELESTQSLGYKGDIVSKKVEQIKSGERPQVTIGKNGNQTVVIDGNHTLAAYKQLGIKDIPVIDKTGESIIKTKSQLTDLIKERFEGNAKAKLTLPTDEANFKTKTNKIELPSIAKTPLGEKIINEGEQKPTIKLKRDVNITTLSGEKVTIPEDEVLRAYEQGGKALLKDGREYIVSKSQYQNIKNNSLKSEAKPFATELKRPNESVLVDYNEKTSGVKFEEDLSDYFENPERLTSKFFNIPIIKKRDLIGYQELFDLTKSQKTNLKGIEKDILQGVLETHFKGQKKVDTTEFERAVTQELMPLEIIPSDTYATYGLDNVGMRGLKSETLLFNSPFLHGKHGHFPGDFDLELKASELEIKEIPPQEGNHTAKFAIIKKGVQLTEENMNDNVYSLHSTKDGASSWIAARESKNNNGEVIIKIDRPSGLFAHSRIAIDEANKTLYVTELQSDPFQGGLNGFGFAGKIDAVNYDIKKLKADVNYSKESIKTYQKRVDKGDDSSDLYKENLKLLKGSEEHKDSQERKIKELENQKKKLEEQYNSKEGDIERKFMSYRNDWYKMVIKQVIRYAAQKKMKKVMFPSVYGIARIEGYIGDGTEGTLPYETPDGSMDDLVEGDVINYGGEDFTVVAIDGYQDVIVAPSDSVNTFMFNDYVAEDIENRWVELESEFKELEKDFGTIDTSKKATEVKEVIELINQLAAYKNKEETLKKLNSNEDYRRLKIEQNKETIKKNNKDIKERETYIELIQDKKWLKENDITPENLDSSDFKDKLEEKTGVRHRFWNNTIPFSVEEIGWDASVKKGVDYTKETLVTLKKENSDIKEVIENGEIDLNKSIEFEKSRKNLTAAEIKRIPEKLRDKKTEYYLDWNTEYLLGVMENSDNETFELLDFENDIKENMQESAGDIDFKDMGYAEVYYEETSYDTKVTTVAYDASVETLMQPSEYDEAVEADEFEIESIENDTNESVLKNYERNYIKYFNKIRPDAVEVNGEYTGGDGYNIPWYETEIVPEDVKDVEAFSLKEGRPAQLDIIKVPGSVAKAQAKEIIERLKLDGIDQKLVDFVIDQKGSEAFGVSIGNEIYYTDEVPKFTGLHEVVHTIHKNVDNIELFSKQGITKEKIDKELKDITPEGYDIKEILSENGELRAEYMSKIKPESTIGKFIRIIKEWLGRIFNKDNRTILQKFYDTVESGKAKKTTLILPSKNKATKIIRDGKVGITFERKQKKGVELPDFKKKESTLTSDMDKAIAKYPNDLKKATEEFVGGHGQPLYHRSPNKFNEFDISKVGHDSNRQRYGWGLYFSDTIPHNQYGDNLYEVILSKDALLIDSQKPVEEDVVSKIVDAVKKIDKNPSELYEFSYRGYLFYSALSRVLGGNRKDASLFLSKNGIAGLKTGFKNSIGKTYTYNYILFNNDSIKTKSQLTDLIKERFEENAKAKKGVELPDFKKKESTLTTEADKAIAKYPNDLEKATEEFLESKKLYHATTLDSAKEIKKTGVPEVNNGFFAFRTRVQAEQWAEISRDKNTIVEVYATPWNIENAEERKSVTVKGADGAPLYDVVFSKDDFKTKSQLTDLIKERFEGKAKAKKGLELPKQVKSDTKKSLPVINKKSKTSKLTLPIDSKKTKSESKFKLPKTVTNGKLKLPGKVAIEGQGFFMSESRKKSASAIKKVKLEVKNSRKEYAGREKKALENEVKRLEREAKKKGWSEYKLTRELRKAKEKASFDIRKAELRGMRDTIKRAQQSLNNGIRYGKKLSRTAINNSQKELRKILMDSSITKSDRDSFSGRINALSKVSDPEAKLSSILPDILEKIGNIEEKNAKNYLGKKISRISTKGLPYEYAKKIEDIKRGFNFSGVQSEKKLLKRDKKIEWISSLIEQNEILPISPESFKLLTDTPLNEVSVQDLQDIYKEIKMLAHLGKKKNELRSIQNKRKIESVQDEIISQANEFNKSNPIETEEKLSEIFLGNDKKRNSKLKNFKEKVKDPTIFYKKNIAPEKILESLDKFKLFGTFQKTFYKPGNDATDKSIIGRDEAKSFVRDTFSNNDADNKDFITKRVDIPGATRINSKGGLSGVEKVAVYMHSLNKHNSEALIKANNFTKGEIQLVLDTLTNKEKSIGDSFINEYKRLYDKYNKSYREFYGVDMQRPKMFTPIFFEGESDGVSKGMKPLSVDNGKISTNYLFLQRNHTKERLKNVDYAGRELSLNPVRDFMKYSNEMEQFINFTPLARDWNKILFMKKKLPSGKVVRFADILAKEIGTTNFDEGVSKLLSTFVNKSRGSDGSFNKKLMELRSKGAKAVLGASVPVWIRQPISVFTAKAEGPLHAFYIDKAGAEFVKNHKKVTNFVEDRAPQIKNRYLNEIVREINEAHDTYNLISGKTPLSEIPMKGAATTDKWTVVTIWKGMYDMVMDGKVNGLESTEENAKDYADLIIRRTQPRPYKKDLPSLFNENPVWSSFQNMANVTSTYITHDIVGKTLSGKRSAISAAWGLTFSLAISSFLLGISRRGRLPEDIKELSKDMLSMTLGGWFILGTAITGAISGFKDMSFFPLVALQYAINAGVDINNKNYDKAFVDTLGSIATYKGVPFTGPKNMITGALDLANNETTDPRRLFWSDWAMKTKKKNNKAREAFMNPKIIPKKR